MEAKMLYLLSQDVNDGYDTYDSAVVCAMSEEDAKQRMAELDSEESWCEAKDVTVALIGIALNDTPEGVVCASFNAG